MFKKIFNGVLRSAGFQFSRISNLDRQISNGQFKWLQEFEIKTVLDVGANVGLFTTMIHKILPEALIYSFEPLKDCFQNLITNTKDIDRVMRFNVALGSEIKETIINRNEFSASSSLFKMGQIHKDLFPYTRQESEEKIQIVTLDSFKDELTWDRKILLKIDVQGFEIEVLKGMGSLINKIDIAIIETSFIELYEDQPLFNDVFDFLRVIGFSYAGNFDQMTDPKTGKVLQADAIFMKKVSNGI